MAAANEIAYRDDGADRRQRIAAQAPQLLLRWNRVVWQSVVGHGAGIDEDRPDAEPRTFRRDAKKRPAAGDENARRAASRPSFDEGVRHKTIRAVDGRPVRNLEYLQPRRDIEDRALVAPQARK